MTNLEEVIIILIALVWGALAMALVSIPFFGLLKWIIN